MPPTREMFEAEKGAPVDIMGRHQRMSAIVPSLLFGQSASWVHSARVPRSGFASASTCCHRAVVPVARGLGAYPRQFVRI
jgi:hypothetical protein